MFARLLVHALQLLLRTRATRVIDSVELFTGLHPILGRIHVYRRRF